MLYGEAGSAADTGILISQRLPSRERERAEASPKRLSTDCPPGARLVKHARYYWLMLAESHLTGRLFRSTARRIDALAVATG
jgi:hypothetical protein